MEKLMPDQEMLEKVSIVAAYAKEESGLLDIFNCLTENEMISIFDRLFRDYHDKLEKVMDEKYFFLHIRTTHAGKHIGLWRGEYEKHED